MANSKNDYGKNEFFFLSTIQILNHFLMPIPTTVQEQGNDKKKHRGVVSQKHKIKMMF